MARRQDSGSNSSHENEPPNPHNEDRIPEFTDNTRGRAEDDDADEMADLEDEDDDGTI